jgi:hypothetical protein
MKIGHWRSTAFLDYIRSQVEEFAFDVSSKMLQTTMFQHFDITKTAIKSSPASLHNTENDPRSSYAMAIKMVRVSYCQRESGGRGQRSVKKRFKPNLP